MSEVCILAGVAFCLVAAGCTTPSGAPLHSGDFRMTIVGNTILLQPENAAAAGDDPIDKCIAATASPTTVRTLRAMPERTPVRVRYEELAYPDFRPRIQIGDEAFDSYAIVRKQLVQPWCEEQRFFWLHSVQADSRPGRTGKSLQPIGSNPVAMARIRATPAQQKRHRRTPPHKQKR
jgi:hypothetical protein